MDRYPATTEQKLAATSPSRSLFINAAPGSGKTRVAAERFGLLRFGSLDCRRVLGLSFTRSATLELKLRIVRRWGTHALNWPHRVQTIDSLYCWIIEYLLETGAIVWPQDLKKIEVLDTWRGQRGCRYLLPVNQYRRVAVLQGAKVQTRGKKVTRATYGIGTKREHDQHLAAGVCTHDDIREIFGYAIEDARLRRAVGSMLQATTRAVVLDEVFDANYLDLNFVDLLTELKISVTLIGDPWQALYEFRGAQPDLVDDLTKEGFVSAPLMTSFRFETESMQLQAERLRAGLPIELEVGHVEDVDVVLAAHWKDLWSANGPLLPLSFGSVDNRTDALMILLLDQALRDHFGVGAIYAAEAASVLGIPSTLISNHRGNIFRDGLEQLLMADDKSAESTLQSLRKTVRNVGVPSPIRRLRAESEEARVNLLKSLKDRLNTQRPVVGMTVHQAKGREWDKVGVVLQPAHSDSLASGLRLDRSGDRLVYVATTRARKDTLRIV